MGNSRCNWGSFLEYISLKLGKGTGSEWEVIDSNDFRISFLVCDWKIKQERTRQTLLFIEELCGQLRDNFNCIVEGFRPVLVVVRQKQGPENEWNSREMATQVQLPILLEIFTDLQLATLDLLSQFGTLKIRRIVHLDELKIPVNYLEKCTKN